METIYLIFHRLKKVPKPIINIIISYLPVYDKINLIGKVVLRRFKKIECSKYNCNITFFHAVYFRKNNTKELHNIFISLAKAKRSIIQQLFLLAVLAKVKKPVVAVKGMSSHWYSYVSDSYTELSLETIFVNLSKKDLNSKETELIKLILENKEIFSYFDKILN